MKTVTSLSIPPSYATSPIRQCLNSPLISKNYCLLIIFIISLFMLICPIKAHAQGVELFHKGQYTKAYAALQAKIKDADPEAAFYGLIIRRNGLDGRAPAQAKELADLWKILRNNENYMRQCLSECNISDIRKAAYYSALAQLDYFGPNHPPWPPGPGSPEQLKKAQAIFSSSNIVLRKFTPDKNFRAYLALHQFQGHEKSAFKLTLRAAEAGDHIAMANLSWMYIKGIGTAKNNLRAAHWAREGAKSKPGVPRAQNELAYCYELGLGVSQDLKEAARWYSLAGASSYQPANKNTVRLKNKGNNENALKPDLSKGISF